MAFIEELSPGTRVECVFDDADDSGPAIFFGGLTGFVVEWNDLETPLSPDHVAVQFHEPPFPLLQDACIAEFLPRELFVIDEDDDEGGA